MEMPESDLLTNGSTQDSNTQYLFSALEENGQTNCTNAETVTLFNCMKQKKEKGINVVDTKLSKRLIN